MSHFSSSRRRGPPSACAFRGGGEIPSAPAALLVCTTCHRSLASHAASARSRVVLEGSRIVPLLPPLLLHLGLGCAMSALPAEVQHCVTSHPLCLSRHQAGWAQVGLYMPLINDCWANIHNRWGRCCSC